MKIAILLYEGFTALDAIGPYEVLSRLPEAKVHFVAENSGPQRADTQSLALIAETPLSVMPNPDIVVIPGGLAGSSNLPLDDVHLYGGVDPGLSRPIKRPESDNPLVRQRLSGQVWSRVPARTICPAGQNHHRCGCFSGDRCGPLSGRGSGWSRDGPSYSTGY
jgi:hypothetical protein